MLETPNPPTLPETDTFVFPASQADATKAVNLNSVNSCCRMILYGGEKTELLETTLQTIDGPLPMFDGRFRPVTDLDLRGF